MKDVVKEIDKYLNTVPKEILVRFIMKNIMFQKHGVIKEIKSMELERKFEKVQEKQRQLSEEKANTGLSFVEWQKKQNEYDALEKEIGKIMQEMHELKVS